MTTQHFNGQCEVLLPALKHGSSPAGLSVMGENSPLAGTQLIRPLLAQTREALETWAWQHELCWIEDESNQGDIYDRNFLRLHVTPLLQQHWLCSAQAVVHSATLCAEQENLLDELLVSGLADYITVHGTLLLVPLMMVNDMRRATLLRHQLTGLNALMPSRDGLGRTWREAALAREDASPCFRLREYEVRHCQSQLWQVESVDGQSETIIPRLEQKTPLALPVGLGSVQLVSAGELYMPQGGEAVSIRFKASGLLHIIGRNGGRKLKKV